MVGIFEGSTVPNSSCNDLPDSSCNDVPNSSGFNVSDIVLSVLEYKKIEAINGEIIGIFNKIINNGIVTDMECICKDRLVEFLKILPHGDFFIPKNDNGDLINEGIVANNVTYEIKFKNSLTIKLTCKYGCGNYYLEFPSYEFETENLNDKIKTLEDFCKSLNNECNKYLKK